MPPLSPAAFRERLAALSPDERAALVAAVYCARGRAARADGRLVRLRDGPRPRTLCVGRDPPEDADGTVTVDEGDGETATVPGDVVRAEDLRELLLYGLDPEDGNRVAKEHLGVPLRSTQYARRADREGGSGSRNAASSAPAAATRGATRRDGTTAERESAPTGAAFGTDRTGDRLRDRLRAVVAGGRSVVPDVLARPSRRVGAAVLLAATLILAAALGGAGLGLPLLDASGDGDPAPSADAGTTGAGTGPEQGTESSSGRSAEERADAGEPVRDGVSGENVTADDETRIAGDASRNGLPPGVGLDGDVDASALAAAHGRVLDNRSYALVITHREFRDGRPTAMRREVARVADGREYVSSVTGAGETTATVQTVAGVERFANGSVRATRPVDDEGAGRSTRLARTDPEDPFRDRSVRYVRWFASVRNSTVVEAAERDGRVYYWLALANDPWPGVANSTGSLLVDERGLVHSIRRSYDVPDRPGVSVVVTVEVTNVGETTVTPPAWYPLQEEVSGPGGGTPSAPEANGSGSDSDAPNASAVWAATGERVSRRSTVRADTG
jgi:hypothetical protein